MESTPDYLARLLEETQSSLQKLATLTAVSGALTDEEAESIEDESHSMRSALTAIIAKMYEDVVHEMESPLSELSLTRLSEVYWGLDCLYGYLYE